MLIGSFLTTGLLTVNLLLAKVGEKNYPGATLQKWMIFLKQNILKLGSDVKTSAYNNKHQVLLPSSQLKRGETEIKTTRCSQTGSVCLVCVHLSWGMSLLGFCICCMGHSASSTLKCTDLLLQQLWKNISTEVLRKFPGALPERHAAKGGPTKHLFGADKNRTHVNFFHCSVFIKRTHGMEGAKIYL